MEIKLADPKSLIPHPKNPRKGHAVDKILASIKEFGFTSPVLVQKGTNMIIAGHGRWKAAVQGGVREVPAIELDISDAKAKALMIADNRIAEESSWEKDLLKELVLELKADDFNLALTAFDSSELMKFFSSVDSDEVPELPKEAISKRGEIYKLGEHRLVCGDALNREDVSKLMSGQKADIVFTDPPYGVSYSDKNKFLNEADKGNKIQKPIEHDDLNETDIQAFWKKAFEIIRDNLAEENSYYIFGPQIQGMMMMMMMMAAGLPYRHVLIWIKNNHVLGRCDYNYKHEPIFFGWTTKHKFYGNGEFQTSVWPVDKSHKSDLHPTMKPTRLTKNALLNSSVEGQICLDPFGGSGSTLIACEETNRRCFMMEFDPLYVDVIISRWEFFTGKKAEKLNG